MFKEYLENRKRFRNFARLQKSKYGSKIDPLILKILFYLKICEKINNLDQKLNKFYYLCKNKEIAVKISKPKLMTLSESSIKNLIYYVQHNEVVYQCFGGLIEIANTENLHNREVLIDDFEKVSSVEVYTKGASFIHEDFLDLDNWAKENDVLFMLEIIGILICVPKKLAIENNIITECLG